MTSNDRKNKILVSPEEDKSVREPANKKKIPIKRSLPPEGQDWAKDSKQSFIKRQNTSLTAVSKKRLTEMLLNSR